MNTLLKEYLDISIKYDTLPPDNSDTLEIKLFNCTSDKVLDFEELSSGQKSILTLIFLVITSELENGMLVIDEPEIHLHPKLQKKYFELLKDFSEKINLQSLLITHSPVFIDEKTIKNTFRFYIDNTETKIVRPTGILASEEELIKFLSYTNSSKIFFTNKVVIVEGDTDSYFFNYILNNEIKTNQEIEFLAIGGKGTYKKWFDFLDKFKIKHYLITDFDFLDNKPEYSTLGIQETRKQLASQAFTPEVLAEIEIIPPQTEQQILEAFKTTISNLISKSLGEITQEDLTSIKKGAFLEKQRKIKFLAVTTELENNQTFKTNKDQVISDLRNDNIYVLKWGDLEDYLSIQKGLQNVVDYCSDNKFQTMEQKLKDDITCIFSDILSK